MAEVREAELKVEKREDVSENLDPQKTSVEALQDQGVTLRAIVFGLCITVAVSLLANTVRYVQKGSYMAISLMPVGNLLLFLPSVLACAALAWWFGRRFTFSPTEWITIFCLGFISSLGPIYGVTG